MKRADKEKEVATLKEKMAKAKQVIIADHTGIAVAELSILRRKLKEGESEFRVAKNTLLKLAVKDTDLAALDQHFSGATAVVFGYDDPTVPAKIVYESIKETEKPKFKAYYLDGAVHDFDTFKKLAELPPKDIVVAQLAASIEGPIVQLVMLLEAGTRDLVSTLEALVKQKGE